LEPIDSLRRVLPKPVKDALRSPWRGVLALGRGSVRLVLGLVRALLGHHLFLALCHACGREIDYTVEVAGIAFEAREPRPYERARELLTKETDTIVWLDRHVGRDEMLYDIGANIGVFGLYAAVKRGARVAAFEPMCTNYDILNRNIRLNRLDGRMAAYCLAFNDRTMVSRLAIGGFVAGKSGHTFDHALAGTPGELSPEFSQGMIGLTVDDFIDKFGQPFPNHIKIDVDGNEPRIIAGMKRTLADARLKSIAIELDLERREADRDTVKTIEAAGFAKLAGEEYVNLAYVSWTSVHNYFFVRRA
jgi:FkbM family methyltransferase